MEEIEKQIEVVKEARCQYSYFDGLLNLELHKFELDHAGLVSSRNLGKEKVAKEESRLREMAVAAYQADPGNKKPAPGVGIRITKKCDYVPEKAFQYAKLHGVCLSLDEKAFVALALKSKDTDIPATIREEAQATIAKEL